MKLRKIIMMTLFITGIMACKNNSEQSKIIEKENDLKEELKTQESEWQILFDGISYEQWRGYLAEDIPQEWIIEDGAMAFIPGSGGGKNIITKDKFTNFILSLEWKISEGGNSGIFWGVYEDAKFPEAYQTGPEIQIVDNEKHPDAQYEGGTHKAGSLFDMIACPDSTVKPAGEWNLCVMEINHKTNLGKVIMNNIEVFTFPLHGDAWETMVANSKFKDWEGFGRYKTGHIGLQDHGNKVWFRNIKIKKL